MILGEELVTLTTYTSGRGIDGRTSTVVAGVAAIFASVQPMNGDDLQTLAEGERTRKGRKFYTTTALRSESPADRIEVDGVVYELRHVEAQRSVIPHYKAIGVQVDEATPDTVSLLALFPVALFRAIDANETAGNLTSWSDSSGNAHNASVIVGPAPAVDATYAGFGDLPAVVFAGAGYVETVDTFTAGDLTLIAGYVATGITMTSGFDIVAVFQSTDGAWLGRNDTTADSFIGGVREAVPPFGGIIPAIDDVPHVIAVRRSGTTRTVWLDGVLIATATVSGLATGVRKLHIGGSVFEGDTLTGAIGCVAYFDRALSDVELLGASRLIWSSDLGQPGLIG